MLAFLMEREKAVDPEKAGGASSSDFSDEDASTFDELDAPTSDGTIYE